MKQELEVALESAKRHAEVLEESLDVTSKELKTALVRAEFLSKELKDAEGKIKSLENKEDLLRSELAVAESKVQFSSPSSSQCMILACNAGALSPWLQFLN